MRVLWICGLPKEVETSALQGRDHGSRATWSWVVAHLPPPPNIDLHVGCLWPGGNQRKTVEYRGAKFHLLPCPSRGRALLLFLRDTTYFRPLFDELRPDVVHGWGTEDSFGLVARRLAPQHHLIGIQGLLKAYRQRARMPRRTFLTAMTEKWTLARARYVVAESEYSIREGRLLCPPNAELFVIEHPLRREFLEAVPSNGTTKSVLFVGEIQERKGINDALAAFAQAAPLDWKLMIVGAGSQEEQRSLHLAVENLSLKDRVEYAPFCGTDELVRRMQASSVFLLPTRIDTGPTALKEALCMGLWPVCYDNSGPGEYVRKYGFGSLATDNDVTSLTEQLRHVLNHHPWKDGPNRSALATRTRHDFCPATAWIRLAETYKAIASGQG